MTGIRLKKLCVVGVSSRFDCGECGIRVLRCGEMCIENRALGKKSRDIRHPFGKMRTHDIPWQSIDEDIQYEFMPPRAVPEVPTANGAGSSQVIVVGAERRI